MYEYLIYNQLKKHFGTKKNFHVPGHKARGEFVKKFPVAKLDVTELSYSDNLACPDGVIARAQAGIAEILGAKRSYIVTDGSTCCVLAMLYVASKHGGKIIVPRNSHQSVWNACKLFGLEPVIVQGGCKDGVLLPPDPDEIEELLKSDVDISGMVVTSPDYYGNIAPLSEYSEVLSRSNRLLLVDGAHGAHLAFGAEKRGYAGVYADIWVDGAHKTLPVLTQGAVLSVKKEGLIPQVEEGLAMFRTSSPSYPIMASVEYGVKFIANNPNLKDATKLAAAEFRKNAQGYTLYPSRDWTKLAVDFEPLCISPDLAEKLFEKKGIYPEFSDGRYILFYISPMTAPSALKKLDKAIKKVIHKKKIQKTYSNKTVYPAAERTYSFQYALKSKYEEVPLEQSAGRMCAASAGRTPPCIPIVAAGEIITEEAIAALKCAKFVYGLKDGKIRVVKL